ncbi:beta-galactosidase [Agaribacterium sp. ZY112]|uniref:beta-galactosidase n=1 Tax=Agaribacterium sp. ZY112 TaxID=3233574 RepID=UPI003524C14C
MKKVLFLILASLSISCTQTENAHIPVDTDETLEILYDFEDGVIAPEMAFPASKGALVETGSTALNVKFNSENNAWSAFVLKPETPYDWSAYDDFNIAFDISNQGEHSVHIYLDVGDAKGANYTRAVNVPVGPSRTYYAKIAGHDLATPDGRGDIELNFLSGLRNNPVTWESDDEQFISFWGKKNINTSAIKHIRFSVQSALFNKEITIDNIRLRKNPPKNPDYLTDIVDKFGQNAKLDYPGKIHSEKELIKRREKEAETLTGELMHDRSRFGGWKNGPKSKATGYFRAEKVKGKWMLIDPEGYAYFATGLDIIRLGDAATMTGYDYESVQDRTGRHVELALRADMFEWLPKKGEPLAKHFGYMPNTHSGALKKGESFNFQRANLERKYGKNYEQKWLDVTVDRMISWGFTSLGNWTSPKLYQNNKIPYFANGWIRGKYKTVSSGQDFWGALPDVFDPAFAEATEKTAMKVAREVQDSPWCVGVFIDNEKSFGRPNSKSTLYGIVINTLRRDGAEVPTKAHFTKMMKARYASIAELNEAWKKNISSWSEFDKGIDSSLTTEAQEKDYGDMLGAYGEQYFSIVNTMMKKYMPNHLYLGARFPDWGMPIEVVKASAKHVDVISFNVYKEGLIKKKWDFMEEIDMPAIIGEFHMGATDRGMYHPGLIVAADQKDRAKMLKDYMYSVIDNPYFVGAHYFQYADGPLTGRAYDGENYNIGFISVTDEPYAEMVEASKELNAALYTRRFSD